MRVLFLTHRLPYAPNRGDRIRAYHIVKSLAARMDVEVVSLVHDDHEMAQAERLRQIGVRVTAIRVPRIRNLANAAVRLLGPQPLTHLLLAARDWRQSSPDRRRAPPTWCWRTAPAWRASRSNRRSQPFPRRRSG